MSLYAHTSILLRVDLRCDCKGDPERDALTALRGLRRDAVATRNGYRRTVSGLEGGV